MVKAGYRIKYGLLRVFLVSSAPVCNQVLAQQGYSNFIDFGDSLSDTGNLASASVNFPYPYFENRISDGPVAIDYLSADAGDNAVASAVGGYNFSVAGGNVVGAEVEDLTAQISAYLDRVGGNADAQALYFLMIGGNDLRGLRSQSSNVVAQALMVDLVEALIGQLRRLNDAGSNTFLSLM